MEMDFRTSKIEPIVIHTYYAFCVVGFLPFHQLPHLHPTKFQTETHQNGFHSRIPSFPNLPLIQAVLVSISPFSTSFHSSTSSYIHFLNHSSKAPIHMVPKYPNTGILVFGNYLSEIY